MTAKLFIQTFNHAITQSQNHSAPMDTRNYFNSPFPVGTSEFWEWNSETKKIWISQKTKDSGAFDSNHISLAELKSRLHRQTVGEILNILNKSAKNHQDTFHVKVKLIKINGLGGLTMEISGNLIKDKSLKKVVGKFLITKNGSEWNAHTKGVSEMLIEISKHLVSAEVFNIDKNINQCLEKFGKVFSANTIFIHDIYDDKIKSFYNWNDANQNNTLINQFIPEDSFGEEEYLILPGENNTTCIISNLAFNAYQGKYLVAYVKEYEETIRTHILFFTKIIGGALRRKEMEYALKRKQDVLHVSQEITKTASWELNMESNELIGSSLFYDLLQWNSHSKFFVENFKSYLADRDYSKLACAFELSKEGKSCRLSIKFATEDWEKAMHVCIVPFKNLHNEIQGIRGTIQDVTNIHSKSIKIEKKGQEFESLLAASPIPMVTINADQKFTKFNQQFIETFEYSEDELLTMSFPDITHPDDLEEWQDITNNMRQVTSNSMVINKRYITKYGKTIYSNTSIQGIYNKLGQFIGSVSIINNITDLKVYEHKLFRNNRLLTQTLDALKHTSDLLRQEQINLKEAQRIANIGSWERNLTEDISTWSDQMYEIYEVSRSHFIPSRKNSLQLCHEDDRNRVKNIIRNAYSTFEPVTFDNRIVTGLGKTKHVRSSLEFILSPEGEPFQVIGTCLDITKDIEREEEQQKTRHMLKRAHKIAKLGSWEWDRTSGKLEVSDNLKTIFELPQNNDKIDPLAFVEAVHPLEYDNVLGKLQQFISTPMSISQFEYKIKTPSGIEKHILFKSDPPKEHVDTNILFGTVQDITEQRQVEQAYIESETNFRQLSENTLAGIFIIQDDVAIYANRAILSMLGHSFNSLKNIPFYQLIHKNDRQQYLTKYNSIKHKTGATLQEDIRLITKGGEIVYTSFIVNVVELEGKSAVLGACFDNTELIKTNRKLKEENNRSQRFHLQLISSQINPHFIFNSLNSIQYYILDKNTVPALDFLAKFSMLIRKALYNSRHFYISFEEELEFLNLYLDLEKNRFNDKFNYELNVDEELEMNDYYVPPMLLQPYIENSIIHGIGNKENGQGLLKIEFTHEEDYISCIITDNGIGRAQAQKLKQARAQNAKHTSMGTDLTNTRLQLLNQLEDGNFSSKFSDVLDQSNNIAGTQVKVRFPTHLGLD